jgi:hypothetical protein
MSGDLHPRREDPEHDPLTEGRGYNLHIVLLQAPIHPSSLLECQILYFPIPSNTRALSTPPTPLHRVTPTLTSPSRRIHVDIQPAVKNLHILTLASNPAPYPYCPPASLATCASKSMRDELTRGSSPFSHHEGRPDSSSTTPTTPASAGRSKTRSASTSPMPRVRLEISVHSSIGSSKSGRQVPGYIDFTSCGDWVGGRDVFHWYRCLICLRSRHRR